MGAGPIRASTGGRRTKPTSTGCRRLRQPEPGGRSTYQAAEPVQTNRASSLVGVHQGAPRDRRLDHRPDRPLPDVGEHTDDDLAPALDQAQDGRLVLGERAAAGSTPQPPPAARPPFFATAAGWPLWPATTSTSS